MNARAYVCRLEPALAFVSNGRFFVFVGDAQSSVVEPEVLAVACEVIEEWGTHRPGGRVPAAWRVFDARRDGWLFSALAELPGEAGRQLYDGLVESVQWTPVLTALLDGELHREVSR